jgi:hypothetical protein
MASKPTPAIRGRLDERYSDVQVIERVGSDTTFHRGLGDIGTVVELVDMSETKYDGCPFCGEPEMILSKDLGPETVDGAFYCTNIKCPYFVQDAVEYDMDKIRADQPEVWDNTAICPRCENRFTTRMRRGLHTRRKYVEGNAHDGGIIGDVVCDDCLHGGDDE